MAGGVALNCTMNGKITSETPFERVYIQPAAYDGGTALGAALYVKHQILGAPRDFTMDHTYWGLEYSPEECRAALDALIESPVTFESLPVELPRILRPGSAVLVGLGRRS